LNLIRVMPAKGQDIRASFSFPGAADQDHPRHARRMTAALQCRFDK
jgi:hypothetical protein